MASSFRLDPPPGFRGLDPHEPIKFYKRHLPHWRQEGATYFVTFRLSDSLPQEKLDELKQIRLEWQRELDSKIATFEASEAEQKAAWEKLARITLEKSERWLDEGMGSCVLRDPGSRRILSDSFHFFDGKRYEMGSYVIMPNHAHLVIRPFLGYDLESILQGRKGISARKINKRNRKGGPLWQEESYDRIVRDAEHLWKCVQYIGKNPRKAKLREDECTRWIRPDWQSLGWDFFDSA